MKEKKKRKLQRNRLVALALAAIISVGTLGVNASAAVPNQRSRALTHDDFISELLGGASNEPEYESGGMGQISFDRDYRSLAGVNNKSVYAYARKNVLINGATLSVSSLSINGIDYIPFRKAAEAIGASYSYNSSSNVSTMRANGLTLTAGAGAYTVYANDRPLFALSPVVIMNDGRMYIPADSFAKALGMKVDSSAYSLAISGNYSPLRPASSYYREDEILWLARIIHAESQGEPLLGKIAVGNVVLNRVRSKDYPNTIYGVIFDRKYGVQFSPILDGSIYNTPSYNSYLAAKICLEGVDVSEGALFFLQPRLSTSSWIPKNRPYMFTIGGHDFYR